MAFYTDAMIKGLRHRGFTLIELVVVIALLGVLAAFAIPRFANLEASAREAVLQGVAGSTRSASTLAHAQSLVQGIDPNDPIQMEGQAISMVGGYPDAQGMALAAQLELGDSFQIQYFGDVAFIIFKDNVATWSSCGFAYVRAIPPGAPVPRYFGPFSTNCN